MIICPKCGAENPDDATVCQQCGEPLSAAGPPPRLLSQIQGLIPAEPVITSGRRHDPQQPLPLASLPEQLPAPQPEKESQKTSGKPVAAIAAGAAAGMAKTAGKPTPEEEEEVEETAAAPPPPSQTSSPPPPPAPPSQPKIKALPIIAAVIFAVILLGSVWHGLTPSKTPVRPGVKDAYTFIEILPAHARVLLSWDYDPATQGELQLLAQPMLTHLQQKRASLVFMSLRPFGPSVAADALAFSRRWQPPGMIGAGSPPVEFGFIPGESAALRSLALSPVIASNQPVVSAAASGINPAQTIDAFDLIIEFSSDMASSQQWVEQIAARSHTPLIVAASGAMAPALRPYEQTRQIRVLLAGYPDALAYEGLLGQEGPARAQTTAQTLTLLVLLGVVFLAAFRSLLRR